MATTVLGLKTFTASDPVDYNEINDNYNKIDNGVKTALQGRAAHNLLDNSDFRNPVNQRGQTTYTGSAFTVDRWRTWNDSATITLTSDGIKGDGTDATVLYQGIELHKIKLGTAYTVAAGYSDGTISCGAGTLTTSSSVGIWNSEAQVCLLWGDGSPFMRLWHATKTIQWAAIYPGSYDASTLPAYKPKGYAAELAECKRYYKHNIFLQAVKSTGNTYFISRSFDIPMLSIPTYTFVKSDVYGVGTFNDFTECYFSLDANGVYYALLPTLTSYNNVSLVANFSADL